MGLFQEIEKCRQRMGVKPTELSTAAGFHKGAYGQVLAGKFAFKPRSLQRLKDALERIDNEQKAMVATLNSIGGDDARQGSAS
jgi:predicted transcriptional regulator